VTFTADSRPARRCRGSRPGYAQVGIITASGARARRSPCARGEFVAHRVELVIRMRLSMQERVRLRDNFSIASSNSRRPATRIPRTPNSTLQAASGSFCRPGTRLRTNLCRLRRLVTHGLDFLSVGDRQVDEAATDTSVIKGRRDNAQTTDQAPPIHRAGPCVGSTPVDVGEDHIDPESL